MAVFTTKKGWSFFGSCENEEVEDLREGLTSTKGREESQRADPCHVGLNFDQLPAQIGVGRKKEVSTSQIPVAGGAWFLGTEGEESLLGVGVRDFLNHKTAWEREYVPT